MNIHRQMNSKFVWYKKWHQNPSHQAVHWITMVLFSLMVTSVIVSLITSGILVSPTNAFGYPAQSSYEKLAGLTQRVLSLSKDYNAAIPTAQNKILPLLIQVTTERRDALKNALETDPTGASLVMMTDKVKKQLPSQIDSLLEKETVLTGVYEFIHGDDFENGVVYSVHNLRVSDNNYTLYFSDEQKDPVFKPGLSVKLSGFAIDKKILITNKEQLKQISSVEPQVAGITTPTVKKLAIIMFNLRNNVKQVISPSSARSVTFTGTSSANKYYQEESFGAWQLQGKIRTDGDIYGPYTINYDDVKNCDYNNWSIAAENAAAAEGFSPDGYTNIIYIFPSLGGCPGRAFAYLAGTRVFVTASYNAATVIHELGHNYSLEHSSSWACTGPTGAKVSISSKCSASEYGDFAVMGATTTYHMNNRSKGKLGFFSPENTLDVTTDGLYTVVPVEINTTGVQTLRIPRQMDSAGNILDYYYLEFRQPYGFDNFAAIEPKVNGLLIRVAPAYLSVGRSFLLDATTPALTNFTDAPLALNQTFTDSAAGVSIKTVSTGPNGAQAEVHFFQPICTPAKPTVTITPTSVWQDRGASANYTLSITNNNYGCGASNFSITPTLPSGFVQVPYNPVSIGSVQTVRVLISIMSPSTAAEGLYQFTQTINDLSHATGPVAVKANYNVSLPGCTRANPSISMTSGLSSANPGGSVTYDITVTDNDTDCPAATFTVTPTLPSGFVQTPPKLSVTLGSRQSITQQVSITAPATATVTSYTVTEKVTNSTLTTFKSTVQAIFNVISP